MLAAATPDEAGDPRPGGRAAVILNHAPPLPRYEAIAAGTRRFARDEMAADRYEEKVARECFDTEHLRKVQQRLAREAREASP